MVGCMARLTVYLALALTLSACTAQPDPEPATPQRRGSLETTHHPAATDLPQDSPTPVELPAEGGTFGVAGEVDGVARECSFSARRDGEGLEVTCFSSGGRSISLSDLGVDLLQPDGSWKRLDMMLHPRWGTGSLRGGASIVWREDSAPESVSLRVWVGDAPAREVRLASGG